MALLKYLINADEIKVKPTATATRTIEANLYKTSFSVAENEPFTFFAPGTINITHIEFAGTADIEILLDDQVIGTVFVVDQYSWRLSNPKPLPVLSSLIFKASAPAQVVVFYTASATLDLDDTPKLQVLSETGQIEEVLKGVKP